MDYQNINSTLLLGRTWLDERESSRSLLLVLVLVLVHVHRTPH